MGKIPDELRETIARNIRNCRLAKYPGRGGSKKCAEEFGVAPQQWSPWERGMRTPDEVRLTRIADFFNTSVEWLRQDHSDVPPVPAPSMPTFPPQPPPCLAPPPYAAPGSPESFYRLAQQFIRILREEGVYIRIKIEN